MIDVQSGDHVHGHYRARSVTTFHRIFRDFDQIGNTTHSNDKIRHCMQKHPRSFRSLCNHTIQNEHADENQSDASNMILRVLESSSRRSHVYIEAHSENHCQDDLGLKHWEWFSNLFGRWHCDISGLWISNESVSFVIFFVSKTVKFFGSEAADDDTHVNETLLPTPPARRSSRILVFWYVS